MNSEKKNKKPHLSVLSLLFNTLHHFVYNAILNLSQVYLINLFIFHSPTFIVIIP